MEDQSSQQGSRIARRLVLHERSRAQVAFLQLLHTVELGNKLILRGSSALHGVYLHQRVAFDLDFLTDAETYAAFFDNPTQFGLPISIIPTQSGDGFVGAYFYEGKLFPKVIVNLDLSVIGSDELDCHEIRTFKEISGREAAPVRVQLLPKLVARKLWYVGGRALPYDFMDLWLVLQTAKDRDTLIADVNANVFIGKHTLEKILRNAEAARSDW